jgi:hypothetical protein
MSSVRCRADVWRQCLYLQWELVRRGLLQRHELRALRVTKSDELRGRGRDVRWMSERHDVQRRRAMCLQSVVVPHGLLQWQ